MMFVLMYVPLRMLAGKAFCIRASRVCEADKAAEAAAATAC